MAFTLTTIVNTVTLDDLGGRTLTATTDNGINLEAEFDIEEIRYSVSLAEAIHNGDIDEAVDDQGRSITAQASLAATQELLRKAFHVVDTDELPEGSGNLYYTDARARNAISIAPGSQNLLEYNASTGQISAKDLLITDVTVDNTYASINAFAAAEYTGQSPSPFQEGDIVVLNAATGGTQSWIHNGGTADDENDFTQLNTDLTVQKLSWNWSASSEKNNNTNRFLDREDGLASNVSPFVAPVSSQIKAISLNTGTAGTWTAQIYINGVASGTATLASGGSKSAQTSGLSTALAAGDEVSIYLNGNGISRPSVNVFVMEN